MKYLKNYKIFLESFQISDSDEPDVKLAKEKMNTLESQISYYKANKSKIDSIYLQVLTIFSMPISLRI